MVSHSGWWQWLVWALKLTWFLSGWSKFTWFQCGGSILYKGTEEVWASKRWLSSSRVLSVVNDNGWCGQWSILTMVGTHNARHSQWLTLTMAGTHNGWCSQWLILTIADAHNGWCSQWLMLTMVDTHNGWCSQWLIITMVDTHNGWSQWLILANGWYTQWLITVLDELLTNPNLSVTGLRF